MPPCCEGSNPWSLVGLCAHQYIGNTNLLLKKKKKKEFSIYHTMQQDCEQHVLWIQIQKAFENCKVYFSLLKCTKIVNRFYTARGN